MGEMGLGELGLGEMGLGEMGQNLGLVLVLNIAILFTSIVNNPAINSLNCKIGSSALLCFVSNVVLMFVIYTEECNALAIFSIA